MEKLINMAKAWLHDARANPYFLPTLLGALGIAALDQLSKFWILHGLRLPQKPPTPCAKNPEYWCHQVPLSPIFDLTYVENRGASFGMLAGGTASRVFLALVAISIIAALTIWLGRLRQKWSAMGVAFIIGGALGNLYDRLSYGFVVDFLDFSGIKFPYVFNVADMAVNVGVGLMILEYFLEQRQTGSKDKA